MSGFEVFFWFEDLGIEARLEFIETGGLGFGAGVRNYKRVTG